MEKLIGQTSTLKLIFDKDKRCQLDPTSVPMGLTFSADC